MAPGLKNLRPAKKAAPPPKVQPEDEVADDGVGAQMSLWDHLDELRRRLTWAVLALVIGTVIGIAVARPVLLYLIEPLPEGAQRLQTLGPTEGVIAYFRVALLIGGIIAIPMITYQVLAFIVPGLTRRERRIVFLSITPITLLFLVGVAFAWFIMVPPAIDFLQNFQSDLLNAEWTADQYLGFITALIFWMGVAFESPLVFFVLSLVGMVTAKSLIQNWRIAVVAAAVAAAVITPTVDPVNMALVIAPLMVLYLLSIILVYFGARMNRAETA
jgi:sec-independent protein translocase protein TatC